MLKKVMSMGFVAFLGVGLMTNTCLAAMSIRPEVLGKTLPNQQSSVVVYKNDKKDLENQSSNEYDQSNNEGLGNASDDAYDLKPEEEKEEQLQEDEDLDDMRTKAVWERKKK